jgi:broad specificity phosphatase PhoE
VAEAARIIVVRHGETEWSLSGQHTSRTDLPLTPAGRERATRLPELLSDYSFSLVLSSPLLRALETAEIAGFKDRVVIDEDLREWDYGEYEGLTTPQIREQRPDWSLWRDGCPGGESPAQVGERADRVVARMVGAEGGALAFAHGHILRVLTARWAELSVAGGARFKFGAGAIGVLGHERETRAIERWNLTPELPAAG